MRRAPCESIRVMRGLALAVVMIALALAANTHADPMRCRMALVKESARYAQAAMKAETKCGLLVVAGTVPSAAACRTDFDTVRAIDAARTKAVARVAAACCGSDGVCGSSDDDPLGAVGWTSAACPDFAHGECTDPIADPGDVAACLTCVGTTVAGDVVDLVYGDAVPAAAGSAVAKCQRALGRAAARFVAAKSKALARCWLARARGRHANVCPEPGDGKAGPAIADAAALLERRAAAACGGLDPSEVGFGASCPAVTVPGGPACGGPVATASDVTACVACVGEFAVDCVDRLAVPAFAVYPEECNPPSPTCSAGVECASALDCPAGHECLDNGGGTHYCVGATCTADAECDGGAVCRQYCTREGCGARRCQCPGFGCAGADELCLDDGGLACRKLCTQDSDCTDPFGLVCVNPGFGFGVCIGSVPCQ